MHKEILQFNTHADQYYNIGISSITGNGSIMLMEKLLINASNNTSVS